MKNIILCTTGCALLQSANSTLFLGHQGGLFGGKIGGISGLFCKDRHHQSGKKLQNLSPFLPPPPPPPPAPTPAPTFSFAPIPPATAPTFVPKPPSPAPKKGLNFPVETPLTEQGNYIQNGHFNYPQIQVEWEFTKNLPGWTSNEIERGIGTVYNANWGNVVVVQLDGNQNNVLKQIISPESGQYILSFKWAGRTDYIQTSGMSVYWNTKKIFQIAAKDNFVHEQRIQIQVRQPGKFVLEFRGEGPSDSYGMTLTNIGFRRDLSKSKPLPPATPLIEQGNYIQNGHFNFPQIQSDYQITNNLPGWTLNEVERGIGSLYNSNWGNVVVVQLDGNQNNVMKQSLSLDSGQYILCFKWAGRTSYTSTSGMSVYWNNKKIFQIGAKDNLVHQQLIPILVRDHGSYVLEFRGEGPSDTYGMTFTDLRLRRDLSKPKPLPLPPATPLTEQGNYIQNGHFNFPQIQSDYEITNSIAGWTSNQVQRGIGSLYNSNWGNVVVVELDGNQNNVMKQSLSLDSGYYLLSFKWAGRTSYTSTSGISVFWNNKKVFHVIANDNLVHEQLIPILVRDHGNYVLEFRGEGPSDTYGMTFTDLRLRRDLSKPKPLPLPPSANVIEEGNFIKNGHFSFPQIQSDYQIFGNLPEWTSNQIERGIGTVYNSNWGNIVVVELDGNQNNFMKQTLSLDSGCYLLSFKWAGRTSYITTSAMSVFWNNKKVFHVSANDNLIHQQVIPILVNEKGNYVVEFRGEGPSDSYGMTITNLRLVRDLSKPIPQPQPVPINIPIPVVPIKVIPAPAPTPTLIPVKVVPAPTPTPIPTTIPIDSTEQVMIQPPKPNLKPNAETTIINYIQVDGSKFSRIVKTNENLVQTKIWQMTGFDMVNANKFSPSLKQDGNVLVTSTDQVSVIRNKLKLNEGNYKFKFDHIAQKGSSNAEKLVVKLNDRVIGEAQPVGDQLKLFTASFKVSKPGQFRFEISAPKSNQAIGILNPRLQIISDSANDEDSSLTASTTPINTIIKPVETTLTTEKKTGNLIQKTTGSLIDKTKENNNKPQATPVTRTYKIVQSSQSNDQANQLVDELLPADDNQNKQDSYDPQTGSVL